MGKHTKMVIILVVYEFYGEGEGFWRRIKRRLHLPKIRTDRQTLWFLGKLHFPKILFFQVAPAPKGQMSLVHGGLVGVPGPLKISVFRIRIIWPDPDPDPDPDPYEETLIWIRVPKQNRDKLAYKSTKIIKI